MMRFASLVVGAACATVAAASGWSYDDQASWPGQCNTGAEQSPVNIVLSGTQPSAIMKPLSLNYGSISNYTVLNNGHSLQVYGLVS